MIRLPPPLHPARNQPVLVVGSINTDFIATCNDFPKPGETKPSTGFLLAAGGKGFNQAVAAARAGANVRFIAATGTDPLGIDRRNDLLHEGIPTDHLITTRSAPTGNALILVNAAGENCIVVTAGSNALLSPAALRHHEPAFHQAAWLLLQLEIPVPTVKQAIQLAHRHSVRVALNPAPFRPIPKTLLSQIDLLTPNESELDSLLLNLLNHQPPGTVEDKARLLLNLGLPEIVVTCGARGAYHARASGARWHKAPKTRAIDSTGAGDCFNGTLIALLSTGFSTRQAIPLAVKAASLSVTRRGAACSFPKLSPHPPR